MVKTRMTDNQEKEPMTTPEEDEQLVVEVDDRETLLDTFNKELDELNKNHNMFAYVQYYTPYIVPYVEHVYEIGGIYLFWIVVHYVSARVYVSYCAPADFHGFVMSPFLASAPHCRATRWAVQNGAETIDNMWLVFATWFCSKLVKKV